MPVYSYKCKNCDHEFEIRQSFSDRRIQVCPVCKGETRRVIHDVPVVFKGSGFYVTDNRNGKGPSSTSNNSKKEPETKEKSEGESGAKKTESKGEPASSPG